MATTAKGLPYPPPTAPVAAGASDIRALAEKIDPWLNAGAASATPPASPVNGQLWLFTANDTDGVEWVFRYKAGAANPWRFVGGAPWHVAITTLETPVAVGGWTALPTAGPDITVPRAGLYRIEHGCGMQSGAAGGQFCAVADASVSNNPITPSGSASFTAASQWASANESCLATLVAAHLLRFVVYQTVAAMKFGDRYLAVTPIAIQ